MRAQEFITEGKNHPIICVDVQPAYDAGCYNAMEIVEFVGVKQTGPVLMLVNADNTGMTDDTERDIIAYWDRLSNGATMDDEEYGYDAETEEYFEPEPKIDWRRFTIVDKGYGYLRAWHDNGVEPATIIRVIRAMYQAKISDSREFDLDVLTGLVGNEWQEWMEDDQLAVNWTSVSQLKRFSGAYLVGGGRNECLREVELLMNAFNIRYKRIDVLTYG